MIKKPIMTNHTFLTAVTFSKINSLAYINSTVIPHSQYLIFNPLFLSSALNVLTYPFILGTTKTNGFISLSKYPIKYLELVLVLNNFEITILSTLTSQIFS